MDSKIDVPGIILRTETAFGLSSDYQFAKFLGVRRSTVCNWKVRNSIDYELLFSKCKGINLNWLIWGEGPIIRL